MFLFKSSFSEHVRDVRCPYSINNNLELIRASFRGRAGLLTRKTGKVKNCVYSFNIKGRKRNRKLWELSQSSFKFEQIRKMGRHIELHPSLTASDEFNKWCHVFLWFLIAFGGIQPAVKATAVSYVSPPEPINAVICANTGQAGNRIAPERYSLLRLQVFFHIIKADAIESLLSNM